jgi:acyl-CoA thioesterase
LSFVYDQDTEVTPLGEGVFAAEITDRWSIAGVPNGGYLMGIALRAAAAGLSHPDPLTTTAHFLGPAQPGPAEIGVEIIKKGRTTSTSMARLLQEGVEKLRLLTTFSDLSAQKGPKHVTEDPPTFKVPLVSSSGRIVPFPIVDRFDYELPPDQAAIASGDPAKPSGRPEFCGRLRFSDGRPPDPMSMVMLADAMPPSVFNLGVNGWIPTIELTVHHRGRPVGQWVTCRLRTRYLIEGLLDEDGEFWDETGRLIALSRQMARVLV